MITSLLWKSLAAGERCTSLSRLFPNGSNVILMYHSVGDDDEYGNVSRQRFRADMEFLTNRYEVVDLPEALGSSETDSKQVGLTFDDGYDNFYTEVLPILREFDVPATVFVVSDAVLGRETKLDTTATLTRGQVRELVKEELVTVGNHTKTHPYLSTQTDEQLREEIVTAREDLEAEFDITVDRFCYPSGDVNGEALSVVQESHAYATTTRPALVSQDGNPHLLPRIDAAQPADRVRWELTDPSDRLRQTAQQVGLLEPETVVNDSKT